MRTDQHSEEVELASTMRIDRSIQLPNSTRG